MRHTMMAYFKLLESAGRFNRENIIIDSSWCWAAQDGNGCWYVYGSKPTAQARTNGVAHYAAHYIVEDENDIFIGKEEGFDEIFDKNELLPPTYFQE